MKLYLIVFVAVALFFILDISRKKRTVVIIGGREVKVELADTVAKRTKGLMFRKEMGEDSGMLFIFPKSAKHSFWMANTYIDLDIIWIDEGKGIVHIEQNVPPCTETGKLKSLCTTYTSSAKAKYVLEVNAGFVNENSVGVGDKIIIKK